MLAPVANTLLLGRESDIAVIADLLLGASARLVTLIGPGGVGKTRLAEAVARRLSNSMSDVDFIPLAPLQDSTMIASTIARSLGLREEEADAEPMTVLIAHLRTKRGVLVLDNLEHVLAAGTPFVAELLASCPELRILVTSRAALRIGGEQEF